MKSLLSATKVFVKENLRILVEFMRLFDSFEFSFYESRIGNSKERVKSKSHAMLDRTTAM